MVLSLLETTLLKHLVYLVGNLLFPLLLLTFKLFKKNLAATFIWAYNTGLRALLLEGSLSNSE